MIVGVNFTVKKKRARGTCKGWLPSASTDTAVRKVMRKMMINVSQTVRGWTHTSMDRYVWWWPPLHQWRHICFGWRKTHDPHYNVVGYRPHTLWQLTVRFYRHSGVRTYVWTKWLVSWRWRSQWTQSRSMVKKVLGETFRSESACSWTGTGATFFPTCWFWTGTVAKQFQTTNLLSTNPWRGSCFHCYTSAPVSVAILWDTPCSITCTLITPSSTFSWVSTLRHCIQSTPWC